MAFLTWIVNRLSDIGGFFYDAYLEVFSWVYPFYLLSAPLYQLHVLFVNLAWDFHDFNIWATDVSSKVANFLDLNQLTAYFSTWINYATTAFNWITNAWVNVTHIIDNWWYGAQQTILALIDNIQTWTITQINTVQTAFLAVVSNLETWTMAEFNTVREWVLALISDIEAITPTILNNVRDFLLSAISDLEAWTVSQVKSIGDALFSMITSVRNWTTAQINNLRDLLDNLITLDMVIAWVTPWWNDRLKDIQDLFSSWLKESAPFWEGWLDVKDTVVEFFTDPWQWFYDRLEDFFERFW